MLHYHLEKQMCFPNSDVKLRRMGKAVCFEDINISSERKGGGKKGTGEGG